MTPRSDYPLRLSCSRAEPNAIELRFDRPYDERSPGTLIHPNGSHVCSLSRAFNGSALRAFDALRGHEVTEERA